MGHARRYPRPSSAIHPVSLGHPRVLPILSLLGLLAVLAALAALAGGASGTPTGSLELAEGQSETVDMTGDAAQLRLVAGWDGLGASELPVLSVQPLPPGWSYEVALADLNGSGPVLDGPGELTVALEVGAGTEPGTYHLEPSLDLPWRGLTLASAHVRVEVLTFDLVLTARDLPAGPARPATGLKPNLAVHASAPVDRTVGLSVDWAPEGWDVVVYREAVSLEGGAPASSKVLVYVPAGARPGQYLITFFATSPDPRAVGCSVTLEVTVGSFPALHLSEPAGTVQLASTGPHVASVTVVNQGNAPSRVVAVGPGPAGGTGLPEGWLVEGLHLPLTVAPGEGARIDFCVTAPDDLSTVTAGLHHLDLRVVTGEEVPGPVFSLGVVVPEVRDLGLGPCPPETELAPVEVVLAHSRVSQVRLCLEDLGNLQGLREVALSASHDEGVEAANVSSPRVPIGSGASWPFRLTVTFSLDASVGRHHVQVEATDGGGGEATLTVTFQVRQVIASLNSQVNVLSLDQSPFESLSTASSDRVQSFMVSVTVVNDGEDALEEAQVHFESSDGESVEYLGYVPVEDLEAGDSALLRITYYEDEPGTYEIKAKLEVPNSIEDEDDVVQVTQAVGGAPVEPGPGSLLLPLVLGAALGALAGLLAVVGTEAGRFALLLMLLVPLYTRLKPDQVRDQFVRGQILGYVKANPGETYTAIKKALGLSNGQFVYHARVLESQGLIRSVKDGANRRFYPEGMRIPEEVRDVKLNQVQRIIYTIILEYPGISQSRISKLIKLAPSTVNYHVNIMAKSGVIERRRSGRLSLCFAVEEGD